MARRKKTTTKTDEVANALVEQNPEVDAKTEAKAKAKAERAAALAEAHAEVARRREAEAKRRLCLCGCGAQTPKAFFVPGHDAKLVSALLKGEAEAEQAA